MIKKLLLLITGCALLATTAVAYWSTQPITLASASVIEFTIAANSGAHSAVQQIASKVPVNPWLLELVARSTGKSARIKAGSYDLQPGTTPEELLWQLVRGEFAQESLVVVEGSTFSQMRRAIAAHPALKHETTAWTDAELLSKIAPERKNAEGLFFPDTYVFARDSSDLIVYRQAYGLMTKKLDDAWQHRTPDLPYDTPYQALIMASIVEKETGRKEDRALIARVFINRLKRGMLLQTDPTVIYGMGSAYRGQIRKRDLLADTPYNTYVRAGLPPTPISLPGEAALKAALNPVKSDALYFVSRGDGSSQFSDNLNDHNRAVNRYQR